MPITVPTYIQYPYIVMVLLNVVTEVVTDAAGEVVTDAAGEDVTY